MQRPAMQGPAARYTICRRVGDRSLRRHPPNPLAVTWAAGNAEPVSASDTRLAGFREALGALMQDLAVQVVRVGEDAEKTHRGGCAGAATDAEARVAAMDYVRLHDLRHSYASRALALGEGLPIVGELLGHWKVETTARYAHLMRDAEKASADKVGNSISLMLIG